MSATSADEPEQSRAHADGSALQAQRTRLDEATVHARPRDFGTVLDLSVPIPAPGQVARQIAVVTFLPVTLGWLFPRFAPGILRPLALFIAECAPGTVDAIPTILTCALRGTLPAVPCSLWIKGRAAGPG